MFFIFPILFAEGNIGIQRLVLLPVGTLDGIVDLSVHTYTGKGLECSIPVRLVIAYCLKQSDHAFLYQVIVLPAYQEHGPCFLADHVLVFFHQIVEDF